MAELDPAIAAPAPSNFLVGHLPEGDFYYPNPQAPGIPSDGSDVAAAPQTITLTPVEHKPEFETKLKLTPVDHTPDFLPETTPQEDSGVLDVPGVGPAITRSNPISKVAGGMATGLADWIETPRKLADAAEAAPQMPETGMWSDEQEAQRQIDEQARAHQAVDWAAGTALGMLGLNAMKVPEPNSVGMFGGKLAKTADHEKLEQAVALDSQLGSPEGLQLIAKQSNVDIPTAVTALRNHIWQNTGWFKGIDGQWRFEIPDNASAMKIDTEGRRMDLGTGRPQASAFEHPALYDAYPETKQTMLSDDLKQRMPPGVDAIAAHYENGDVALNRQRTIDPEDARNSILHENQHAIQAIEGFSPGGHLNERTVIDEANRIINHEFDAGRLMPEETARKIAYQRLAGEVEARNVQRRRDLTPEERRLIPPWETEDTPRERQILKGARARPRVGSDVFKPGVSASMEPVEALRLPPEGATEGHEPGPQERPEASASSASPNLQQGGLGGSSSVAEASRAAADAAGATRPLEGLPVKPLIIRGGYYVPGPLEKIHNIAADYMKSAGLKYNPTETYQSVSIPRARRIAKAFADMKHDPTDPRVKASYDALIDETVAQLKAIKKSGVKIEFIKPGMKDPYYDTPRQAAIDVRDNDHLWVYPTDSGFGSNTATAADLANNPLLRPTGIKIDGRELLANDAFRIVHDFFGHLKDGVGFRAEGEENAWRSHSRMYSPAARPAMTSETRGQNSWLNYGPHGAKNRTAKADATIYADQKTGLMPNWTHLDGAADPFVAPKNEAGNPVRNAGPSAPVNKSVQTVAEPHRMMFPGIYESPRRIAAEAAARVAPEAPEMKQLFGVDRRDLEDIGRGRVGNEEPSVSVAKNPRGSLAAQNIQTPRNTERLIDILGEAGKHPGLAHADAWYTMDPVYKRMVELFGPEEAPARYRHFNTMVGMASPGSDVLTEIARGTTAHAMERQGKFEDFLKKGGTPEQFRGAKFTKEMGSMPAHPYHRTSQAEPMQKYIEKGSIQSENPKVPLYVHASGVPETGFQTSGPVGDAHFSRGVGLSDTRKGPTDVEGSFSRSEYQTLQPWWQHEVAGQVGLESVPAQARLWTVLGPKTGVESALGRSKLELLSIQIAKAAKRLGVSPETARDLILSGKAGASVMAAVAIGLRGATGGRNSSKSSELPSAGPYADELRQYAQ